MNHFVDIAAKNIKPGDSGLFQIQFKKILITPLDLLERDFRVDVGFPETIFKAVC